MTHEELTAAREKFAEEYAAMVAQVVATHQRAEELGLDVGFNVKQNDDKKKKYVSTYFVKTKPVEIASS